MLQMWTKGHTPPTIETHLKPSGVANLRASDSICCASSRVGAMISAYGPRCRMSSVNAGRFEMNESMGITNAAVLPEPDASVSKHGVNG